MIDELFAFPDTNIFLHYKSLAQIDWCGLLKARSVTLVICMPVVQELDEKKSDPRLADRARKAIKDIEEHCMGTKALRAGVSLEIFNVELRRDEFPASLSPDSQDDRIVHLVRKYVEAYPDRNACVITEDFGMGLRCRVGGVTSHRMDESNRLENPGEEKDRKLKEVQRELAILKNRLPKLSISIISPGQIPGGDEPFHCTLEDNWRELDGQTEVEKQRRAHPKHAGRTPSRFGYSAADIFEAHISPERWERYDRELDSYYSTYENYVIRLNTWGANYARTVRFGVLMTNTGTSPATDIDVFLLFPTKIRWVAEKDSRDADLLRKPDPPSLPQRPSSELIQAASSMFRGSSGSPMSVIPALQDILRRPDPDASEVHVVLRPDEGHLIHAKLRKLKHGEGTVLGGFLAVFGTWNDVSSFEVEYSISTSEHPERITGKVPLIVKVADAGRLNVENKSDESAGS